jgi:hypothetical protein
MYILIYTYILNYIIIYLISASYTIYHQIGEILYLSTGWFTKNPPDSGHLATALHGDSEIPAEGPHQAEGAAFKSS